MATLKHLEGQYEILEKLQEGGMGATYKVRHRLLNELRVVKALHPSQDDSARSRFLAEARAATRLNHPNIARIFDCSVDEDGGVVIVMESVTGIALAQLMEEVKPLPLALTLEIARQGLLAIGHLHECELVGRDVSPDNVMLTRDALGQPLVKLLDPGMARDVEGDSLSVGLGVTPSTSGPSSLGGRLKYAPPEAFEDQGQEREPSDPRRGDIYSFALVIYQLLTGRFPISGKSASSLIAGHLFRPPLDFAESDPEGRVPEQVRRAVLKALAKSPQERFADAATFAAEFPKPDAIADLSSREILRILDLAQAGKTATDPSPVPEKPAQASNLEEAPTHIMKTLPYDEPAAEAPTVISRPFTAHEHPADGPDSQNEPTRILRPTFGDESPAEAPLGAETRRLSGEELRALRLEMTAAREPEATEESTTRLRDPGFPGGMDGQILSQPAGRVPVGRSPDVVASDEVASDPLSPTSLPRRDSASPSTPESSEPIPGSDSSNLDETLRTIRALRDDGRAGEAFERLNRAVRQFGPQSELQGLRDELTEALLEQDADEETASQMFEIASTSDVMQTVPPSDAPVPTPEVGDAAPRPGAATSREESLDEASIRGLSDATIRSFEAHASPVRDRPGPPIAHPTRHMVALGLVLVAVLAALVFFLNRNSGGLKRQSIETEDVEAADLSPGSLALDAVPWGEIVSLQNPAAEESPPISPSRFTPVILSLPPGEYTISLRYPPTGQVEERVIRVDSDARVDERIIFENLDAKAYFQRIGW